MKVNIDHIIISCVLLVVSYIIFLIGKLVNDLLHKDFNLLKEMVEKDNPAVALAVSGYYAALILCIGGTLVGPSNGLISDVLDMVIYGFLGIVLLHLSLVICDKLILFKFKISDELIRDQNQGTGAVVFGISLASGFVIFGSVSGEGGNVLTALVFWILGQLLLIVAGLIYNVILPFDIHDEIEKDNVAAGISFAGALIAVGIIVGLSAEGDFESWRTDLLDFLIFSLIGLGLLPVIRFLTDKVLLPSVKLTDEIIASSFDQEKPNVGAAYIEAFSYIAGAFLIYWCV